MTSREEVASKPLVLNKKNKLNSGLKKTTYSPHLNLIEILWRFIKYEWLEIDAYSCWKTLVADFEKIIKEFGVNYVINFV